MANAPHWKKTDTGYALGANMLIKSGRTWRLLCDDGREFDLGRKARFDHAEALITL